MEILLIFLWLVLLPLILIPMLPLFLYAGAIWLMQLVAYVTAISILVAIAIAVVVAAVGLYVLWALALSKAAKKHGVAKPWLAWIPFARSYLLGAIVDAIRARDQKSSLHLAKGMLIADIASSVFSPLSSVKNILVLFGIYYIVAEKQDTAATVLCLLLSASAPALSPAFLFLSTYEATPKAARKTPAEITA